MSTSMTTSMSTTTTTTPDTLEPRPVEPERGPRPGDRIGAGLALGLGLAWYVLFAVAVALEPATTAQLPVIGAVLSAAMLGALAVMAVGLATRRRFGLVASLSAAALLTASSVACPVTGHHGLAAWWVGQLACAVVLVVASAVALFSTRTRSGPARG